MPRGPESSSQDHYAALGVPRDADARAIKKRYRQHVWELRPDVSTNPKDIERFNEISQAYETLSDPQKKAAYDTEQALRSRRATSEPRTQWQSPTQTHADQSDSESWATKQEQWRAQEQSRQWEEWVAKARREQDRRAQQSTHENDDLFDESPEQERMRNDFFNMSWEEREAARDAANRRYYEEKHSKRKPYESARERPHPYAKGYKGH